ncbi:MAG: hypothetical protein NTW92_05600, partial [Bacteroidetes bacterium]|nr:hypothetical protein [Bacteroidota bacterium]
MKKRILYVLLGVMLSFQGWGQSFTLATGSFDVSSTPVNFNCGKVIFNFNTGTTSLSTVDFEVIYTDASSNVIPLGAINLPNSTSSTQTYPAPFYIGVVQFYAVFKDHDNGNILFTSPSYTVDIRTTPTVSGTTPLARCDAGTVILGASPSAGAINWYSASTGGSSLLTG